MGDGRKHDKRDWEVIKSKEAEDLKEAIKTGLTQHGTTFFELKRLDRKIVYDDLSRTVIYFNRHGVLITCEMPTHFDGARVFEFMLNLFENNIEEK